MRGFLKQTGGMRLKCATTGGSLSGELGLNLGSDVNGDRHGIPRSYFLLPTLPPRRMPVNDEAQLGPAPPFCLMEYAGPVVL